MRIKNKDIAEQLGISAAAVSLAINGKPGVSDETRRKVLELVNESARHSVENLNQAKGATEGSVVFCVYRGSGTIIDDKPFFRTLIDRVQTSCARHGYDLVISNYQEGQDFADHLAYLRGLAPKGIVLEATELDREALGRYKSLGVPLVLLDGYFDLDDTDSVALNDVENAFEAVGYLASLGHQRIGHLAGVPEIANFAHRADGFWKGVRENGLEGYEHAVIELPCTVEEAYDAMKSFLDGLPDGFEMPTAFYCDLDYIAVGAMKALQEAGYRVPEDVSLIGSDDISLAAFTTPALTTVRVNQSDLGRHAASLLFRRMNHPEGARAVVLLSNELIVRDSVAAPRQ